MFLFQSTLPRGERQAVSIFKEGFELFQSTLPRGERQVDDVYTQLIVIFQSTLPRGERQRIIALFMAKID